MYSPSPKKTIIDPMTIKAAESYWIWTWILFKLQMLQHSEGYKVFDFSSTWKNYLGLCIKFIIVIYTTNPIHIFHCIPELGKAVKFRSVKVNVWLMNPIHWTERLFTRPALIEERNESCSTFVVVARSLEVMCMALVINRLMKQANR